MGSIRHYIAKLRHSILARDKDLAAEGGIFFGPGHDPKGSFYSPRISVLWQQPESVVFLDEADSGGGRVRGWLTRLGVAKKTA